MHDHSTRVAVGIMAGVVGVALRLLLPWYLSRGSKGSSNPSDARWQRAVQVCGADPRYRLGQVTAAARTYPGRGTLAWVTWHGFPQPQSTWFEGSYPPVESWVVVSGVPAPDGRTFHVTAVHDVIT